MLQTLIDQIFALKALQIRRKNTLRREALGCDRDGRTYWLFAGDPGVLFVQDKETWAYYSEPEEIEQLQKWLNTKVSFCSV